MQIHDEHNLHFDGSKQWGTDKLLKHYYYAKDYDNAFKDIRDKPVRLLEIGVYYGASIILWDKYFPNGDITGIDIDARNSIENIKDKVDSNRTRIIIGDAYQKEIADKFDNFDVVIDDGPHTYESFITFIELYWPKLNKDGYLVIEDILHDDWMTKLADLIQSQGGVVDSFNYHENSDSRMIIAKKV